MQPPNKPRPRMRVGLCRPSSTGSRPLSRPIKQSSSTLPQHPLKLAQSTANPVKPSPLNSKPDDKSANQKGSDGDKSVQYFSVLYTKRSKKKHKSWLDGYVILSNDRRVQLQNEDGKTISTERFTKPLGGLKEGNTLEIASWELEVQSQVAEDDYISGKLFTPQQPVNSSAVVQRLRQKPFKPLVSRSSLKQDQSGKLLRPAHDPNSPDAIILLQALSQSSKQTVPIVLDPYLAKRMRPHQREGIRFLFDCTAGNFIQNEEGGQGAILADEMGLGKSLQAIALIWTLLKQGPFGVPLAKKAIIVCPASLVRNWVNEIRKWLGDERLKPVALESGVSTYESKEAMAAFINGAVRRLLVISYEMFRVNAAQIYQSQCGLMVCDEGHRLKSACGNKTIEALRKLPCRRRVILSGTPVQNDLEEFFAVCDFVNPGCLNSLSSFRAVFANPIISSRDSNAPESVVRLGKARAKELSRVTSQFVLRRTSDLLEKYLPPKTETAIFCRLQPKQESEYEQEARRWFANIADCKAMSAALCAINYLRKICGHPVLITNDCAEESDEDEQNFDISADRKPSTPENASTLDVKESAKMQVTASICDECLAANDKVIIVSNFTTILNLLETMLQQRQIRFCRLDGSTAVNTRGDIVRRFNEGSLGEVFLLSAKAGGVGLNLIGANRLILFDPDWNPATDMQAMARIWRDGQKKRVYVYRLLCTGTIEEKIFQRQLFKGELQSAIGNGHGDCSGRQSDGKEGNFKVEELRDIFQYNGNVDFCDTLDVLERCKEDHRKTGLLELFKLYRDKCRSENLPGMVWCGDDQVLDRALNGKLDTHGIVSYLSTKVVGNNSDESDGNCVTQSLSRVNSKETLRSSPARPAKRRKKLNFDSDDEDESDTNSAAIKTEDKDTISVPSIVADFDPDCEDQPLKSEGLQQGKQSTADKDKDFTWDDAMKHLDDGIM